MNATMENLVVFIHNKLTMNVITENLCGAMLASPIFEKAYY